MFIKYYIFHILLCLSYCQYVASEERRSKLCYVTVPSSMEVNKDIWQSGKEPPEDDLDRFIVARSDCTYKSLEFPRSFYPPAVTFDGTLFEWHGAVRARDDALIQIRWGEEEVIYNFFIGEEDNTITKMFQWGTHNVWTKSTPGILSDERYVSVDIRLEPGTLTFTKECESEPLFTRNITIRRGQQVKMQVHPWSYYGAKFLLDCPAVVTGHRSGGFIQRGELTYLLTFSTLLMLLA